MTGTFYAVGVGPGSPDLLTMQALRVLGDCDVLCFPEIAASSETSAARGTHIAYDTVRAALNLDEKELLFCPLPMTRDRAQSVAAYRAVSEQCANMLSDGRSVAFACIGDVSLYSTAGHLARLIAGRGFSVRFVAGITSYAAAASACALELAGRDSPVTIIPADACYRSGRLRAALRADGTKVLLKAARHLHEILADIDSMGLLPQTWLVQDVSLPDERRYGGEALHSLPADVFSRSYLSVIIIQEACHEF